MTGQPIKLPSAATTEPVRLGVSVVSVVYYPSYTLVE